MGPQHGSRLHRLGALLQAATGMAWCWLLAVTVLPGVGPTAADPALVAVTSLAALTCLLRAVHPHERGVWLGLGIGLGGYAAGFVLLHVPAWQSAGPAGLHLSDTVSLLLYPSSFLGLLALTRRRARPDAGGLLDGAMVATAVGSVALAVSAAAYPSLLRGRVVDVVYALAYPVGGATLLAAVLSGLAVARWRVDRVWVLLMVGFATMTLGDSVYAARSATHTFAFGTPLDTAYTAGPVLVALAAWRPPRQRRDRTGVPRAAMLVPAVATLAALVVLVVAATRRSPEPRAVVAVAATCVLLAVARTALSLRQDQVLAQARRLAATDELTGLANRRELLRLLRARLSRGGRPTALLLADLDGFKAVNDALGHGAGDELLVVTSGRLLAVPGVELVARLGGDEFALVIDGGLAEGFDRAVAVRRAVEEPVLVESTRVAVSASIGVATSGSESGGAAGELVRRADVALYQAKGRRTGVESWDEALEVDGRERLELGADLRAALAGGQFRGWLQPQLRADTGELAGLEVLARWEHPGRGLLTPPDFLAEVESAGLLPTLTRQLLDQALAVVARMQLEGRAVPVAVNLGAPDVLDVDLVEEVTGALARHGVAARLLRLEVTETVVMSDPGRVAGTLAALRDLGVGLSLDDYGTGLASLSYLRALPVDELKIDRSFTSRFLDDWPTRLIVTSTVELAHALGLTVVAEGVEDEVCAAALVECGCDVLQGWWTGRPAPTPPPAAASRAPEPLPVGAAMAPTA